MDFKLLSPGESCVTPELKARGNGHMFSRPDRVAYCILERRLEVAFVAFDLFDPGGLVLYELFVLSTHRGRGIGSRILDFTKLLAVECEFSRVLLYPASSIPAAGLESFYRKNGFTPTADPLGRKAMEFVLADPSTIPFFMRPEMHVGPRPEKPLPHQLPHQ